jgi:hypothetical protein
MEETSLAVFEFDSLATFMGVRSAALHLYEHEVEVSHRRIRKREKTPA